MYRKFPESHHSDRSQADSIQFIEDGEDIVFYKNAAGIAKKVAVEESGNVSDSGIDMTESK